MPGCYGQDVSEPESDGADHSRPGLAETFMLARSTSNEWLIVQHRLDACHSSWARILAILRLGVDIKIVFHDDIRQHEQLVSGAQEIAARGAKVRTTSAWIPEMAISDRRLAIIASDPAQRDDQIAGHGQKIVSILTTVFERAWADATPLAPEDEAGSSNDSPELLEVERELLALLAGGATDETAARHMGISLRTTRRHMAALMSRLAATSRFQAGVEAVKRGWLT